MFSLMNEFVTNLRTASISIFIILTYNVLRLKTCARITQILLDLDMIWNFFYFRKVLKISNFGKKRTKQFILCEAPSSSDISSFVWLTNEKEVDDGKVAPARGYGGGEGLAVSPAALAIPSITVKKIKTNESCTFLESSNLQ